MSQTHEAVLDRPAVDAQTRCFLRERLEFPRGILKLLKETELFGPMIEKALEDIDAVAERFELEIKNGGEAGSFEV